MLDALFAEMGSAGVASFNAAYRLDRHNAGQADPRTTLTYIRSRDRLSKSPAYVVKY